MYLNYRQNFWWKMAAVSMLALGTALAGCADKKSTSGNIDSETDASGTESNTAIDNESDSGSENGSDSGSQIVSGTDIDDSDTGDVPDLILDPLGACMNATPVTDCLSVNENGISSGRGGNGFVVQVPVSPTGKTPVDGTAKLQIFDAQGALVDSRLQRFHVTDAGILAFNMSAVLDGMSMNELAGARYRYQIECDAGMVSGAKSTFETIAQTQGVLRCPKTLLAGAGSGARLYLQEPGTNQPRAGIPVEMRLEYTDETGSSRSTVLFTGESDETGSVNALFDVGEDVPESAVVVAEFDDGSFRQTLDQTVTITRSRTILLTTDKPLYQPGQTIHLRALAFDKTRMAPIAESTALFEILDSKGNKVFKESHDISEYGIASTTFKLATEVLMGTYTVSVTVGDTVSEKSIKVDKYTLPKFDIAVQTDKAFYRPGETVRGTVDARYFFGEPVANAQIAMEGQKFDIQFEVFQSLKGTADADGVYAFEIELPDFFVGQPLDQGDAFALFHVDVTDSAGQARAIEFTRPVVASSVLVQVIPETGDLIPGLDNRFYVVLSDPSGKPVNADCEVSVNGDTPEMVPGSDYGIAVFSAPVTVDEQMRISVTVAEAGGEPATREFTFRANNPEAYVLVRTDAPVYAVGQTATATIFCPDNENAITAFEDRVYVDFVKDGRLINMTSVDLEAGVGTYQFDITPEMVGGFEVEAYYLNQDTTIVRDSKLVYVDPANGLNIEISQDKEVYAPAEEAGITFQVTDGDGNGVQSAIGLQVVDEAVYALMDFRPGIEKVFYELETEIMTPRYEIHGFEMSDVTTADEYEDDEQRRVSAEVLFAASGSAITSISRENMTPQLTAATGSANSMFTRTMTLVNDALAQLCTNGYGTIEQVREHITAHADCWVDPWGTPLQETGTGNYQLIFNSAGPDEDMETADDNLTGYASFNCTSGEWYSDSDSDSDGDSDGDVDGDWGDWDADTDSVVPDDLTGGGGGSGPRVRNYFPETLYVNPALITDENGRAELPLTMADSITTWRMSALASSKSGHLGSTEHGITVFQDFFVDIDMPRTLTQDDEISLPVAIYNYLDEPQNVTLTVEESDWFELLDSDTKVVALQPGEVVGESFTVRVTGIGWQTFTLTGMGGAVSDAVARTVEVLPNGKEIVDVESGRLGESVTATFDIPTDAVDGASKIMVKILPGMMAQAVEGLDSMLRMPSGCFEQTSSATYPNILVLDYMLETDQITPEIELKARDYISQGYQRLLTFEVDGGGFEWFGQTPAHNILTAYGLLEFYDMSKVHPVDPAIIERTRNWLLSGRAADGHFEPAQNGIAEGAINAYEDDVARTTAYLTYALLESGAEASDVDASVNWLKQHYQEFTDGYGLALLANTMVAFDPRDLVTLEVLEMLRDAAQIDGEMAYWTGTGESTTYGSDEVMTTEATALALYALMRADAYPTLWDGAMNYLISQKDEMGNFYTTQATVLTLRAMLESLRKSAAPGPAEINVYLNDELQQTLSITRADSEVLRLVDLGNGTVEGENRVELEITGDSAYMYQIISRYYMPWGEGEGAVDAGPLTIDVAYDKTDLAVDDIVDVTVTVSNTEAETVAKMVLVDVGIPPGFELIADDLNAAVEQKQLQKFEKTPRQLILYVEQVAALAPVVLHYQLRAQYPLVASTGPAEVHPYYEPEKSSQAEPLEIAVSD